MTDRTTTASSVGMSEANAPKHLKAGSVEGLETPFVVTVIAEKPGAIGYRVGFVWANSEDEAIGRWIRYATEDNPGWNISTPAALHITDKNLADAKARLSLTLEGEG